MLTLVAGLVVFLGTHSVSLFRDGRAALIARLGLVGFRVLFSVGALVGLGLLVMGFAQYRAEGGIPVWTPPAGMRHLTMTLMWIAFVALAAGWFKGGRIRGWLRHPMLVAIKTWALAHLLANGDAGGMLVFAAFLAWAVVDRIALKKRGDLGAERASGFGVADALTVVVGTLVYGAMLFAHPFVIGVAILG